MRRAHPRVRWIEPARYHVTLRFLGEVGEDRAALLPEVLARAARGTPPPASIGAMGAFRRRGMEPVFHVAVEGPGLLEVKIRLDRVLQGWGLDPESRPFRAHVTIGRGRRGGGPGPEDHDFPAVDAGAFTVERLLLVESTLNRSGPRYTTRYGAAFSGADSGTPER